MVVFTSEHLCFQLKTFSMESAEFETHLSISAIITFISRDLCRHAQRMLFSTKSALNVSDFKIGITYLPIYVFVRSEQSQQFHTL